MPEFYNPGAGTKHAHSQNLQFRSLGETIIAQAHVRPGFSNQRCCSKRLSLSRLKTTEGFVNDWIRGVS